MSSTKWKVISPIAAIVLWQVLASAGLLGKTPSPWQAVEGIWYLIDTGLPPGYRLWGHAGASLARVLAGFAAACLVAVPVGVLMGWSKHLDAVLDPLVEAVRPVPPLAWLPFAVLWFGIGLVSSSFIIFLGVFFPVLLNTVSGVKSVDPRLPEAARTLGASEATILGRVLVPGASPSIITGIRIGMGIGWMTLVAAEMTGVKSGYGLGYMILTARDYARYDLVASGIIVIGLLGFGMDACIRLVEKRLLRWR
ncbi:MAG: ABC transporter permease [Actinomycetota bacterium]